MTVEQLRRMHQARPFEAFDIHMAGGRSLPVEHPEVLALSPAGRTISVGLPDGTFEIVDLLLVTSLKSRPNGSPRRRRRTTRAAPSPVALMAA
jgi:hypothetical protein